MVFIDVRELATGDRAYGYPVFQHVQHMVAGGGGYREGFAHAAIRDRHIAAGVYGTVCARGCDYRHDRRQRDRGVVQRDRAILRQRPAVQCRAVRKGD